MYTVKSKFLVVEKICRLLKPILNNKTNFVDFYLIEKNCRLLLPTNLDICKIKRNVTAVKHFKLFRNQTPDYFYAAISKPMQTLAIQCRETLHVEKRTQGKRT